MAIETNANLKIGSPLQIKGQRLLEAAFEYWQEHNACFRSSAVVWLKDDSGHMVLFTRGEYERDLMSVVHQLHDEEPLVKPFELPEDKDGDS